MGWERKEGYTIFARQVAQNKCLFVCFFNQKTILTAKLTCLFINNLFLGEKNGVFMGLNFTLTNLRFCIFDHFIEKKTLKGQNVDQISKNLI
jgi:hypothetical protein